LKFGLAVTTPYAGSLNYTDGWVGRYIVQNEIFYTINLNPSVAWRANDWLSLGVGFAVEYVNLMQTVALPILRTQLLDGQANIKAANVNAGFNVGAIVTPTPGTRIGVAYRSQIVHNLTGTTTFLRLPFTPDTKTKIIMPSNVIVSLAQDVSCYGKLLAEAGWAAWSSMRASIVRIGRFAEVTPLNWNNTYRVGVGGQLNLTPDLIVQTGIAFDSSPTTTSARLPDLPFDGQIRVGAGLLYTMMEGVQLSSSYEYMSLGTAGIDNTSSVGVLQGHYSRNYMNTFQFALNITL
jgi:long-chain fatty acid transport protein